MSQATELNFKELPINPDRFCEGISKIGYKPAAALMDIVDNSIAADATRVEIELVTRAGTTNSSAGNIECFRIYDNGSGMSSQQIETALEIGSDVVYPKNSLSKFGFGLKSAGFSLGRRIDVSSKALGDDPASKYLDRDIIRARRQYGVCDQATKPDLLKWFDSQKHGTVVEVSKTSTTHDSAAKVRQELQRRLGVTYFHFLSRRERPLTILIRVGKDIELIQPLDILFWEEASSFNPDKYAAKAPCKVADATVGDDLFETDEKVTLRITIFPMDKMKDYPGFSANEKRAVSNYLIKRENSGFFFYRNGRLIRWGDRVAGVQRDDIGFRACVNFSTAHDEMFHVDVSKQRLELSEDFEQRLSLLCRTPLGEAREAFKICNKMFDAGVGTEGATFNERTEVFEETDPMEELDSIVPQVRIERRAALESETRDREVKEGVAPEVALGDTIIEILTPPPPFQRVRYTDKVIGLDLAVAGTDPSEGTYVRINQNHPFYDLAIKYFDPSSAPRLTVEALLYAGAIAELKTRENLAELSLDQLTKVFVHFRRVFSQNLNAWISDNQDLFD